MEPDVDVVFGERVAVAAMTAEAPLVGRQLSVVRMREKLHVSWVHAVPVRTEMVEIQV
jgi:hypothetical protein